MHIRFSGSVPMQEHLFMKKIELALIKKQIEVLATFMPDEILKLEENEVMHVQNFVGVLLFADVSGFTPLTEKYSKTGKGGIYKLTATLNAYIGAIVDVLCFYGGDVLKFSGDAFLALWKVLPDDSLFEILHEVVVCALVIQQTLGHFDTEVNVQLKVKLAISCGNLMFSIIGDDQNKHYIVVGDAINDVKAAEKFSVSGDIVISPGAWSHMLQERYEVTHVEGAGCVKIWKVFYKPNEESKKRHYQSKNVEVLKIIESHLEHRKLLHAKRTFDSNLTDSKITERFVRSLHQREQMKLAPRHWIVDDLRPFITKNVLNQVDESQPVEYLTEMREITIQFINIIPTFYNDHNLMIRMVNSAYRIICNIVGYVLGVVNKVSLFDKDCMILVLFGLRGVKHEMESQNALRSAFKILSSVSQLEGIKSISIGITNGFVYCGVVGHPMRREYTVIGGAVNKAARIMCAYENKVTCDHKTFKRSQLSSFYFQLQKLIKLKGIEDAGNIFEYNENFDNVDAETKCFMPLIGRDEEIDGINSLLAGEYGSYLGICIYGAMKIGKTALLRRVLRCYTENPDFEGSVASVELEGSSKIPYFCISKLYRQLFENKATWSSPYLQNIIPFPRDLLEYIEETKTFTEDIALAKYRVLNVFRDMVDLTKSPFTIVFIDNFEFVDLQSWEILEIVLNDEMLRLVIAASFEEQIHWDLKFKLSLNDSIRMFELSPTTGKDIAAIACQSLKAIGIPTILVQMLISTCQGRPGYVQSCVLRLVNIGIIEMKLINRSEMDTENFIYVDDEVIGVTTHSEIIAIIEYNLNHKIITDEITMAAISLDLFDSFTPYQQLVIKTSAVLGDLFTRTVLIVALKYPSEQALAKVIKQLFEEEVFDCGSRYVYGNEIDTSQMCCRCYFEDKKSVNTSMPTYAHCKIIHFKNKSIRDVAYNLLPGNQRKELHLLCTDVLENMTHQCPTCLRQPTTSFLTFYKFNDIMLYCNNPQESLRITASRNSEDILENMKNSIREKILECYKGSVSMNPNMIPLCRPTYDSKLCNCYEIAARNYKDLIYHSERANHLGKLIFFSMQHGHLMVYLRDYGNAIAILTEARELCMADARSPSSQITESFRKLHVGKIQIGLAKACLELRQLKAARNHLALALRQYNIPAVALYYKFYNMFLSRSYLINTRRIHQKLYKNTIVRMDMGMCLSFCANLFNLEGHVALAKMASAYSFYLLKSVNNNTPILFDIYCNAIEIYRYNGDAHICEKFQRYILRSIQSNYGAGITQNLYYLMHVLRIALEMRMDAGDIAGATRLGFRVLDINRSFGSDRLNVTFLLNITLLLIYTFRIKDSVDLVKIFRTDSVSQHSEFEYQLSCLIYLVRTGFYVEPFNKIIEFAKQYFDLKKEHLGYQHHLFIIMIQLYYLRMSKFIQADEWRLQYTFNRRNVRKLVVVRTLLFDLECKMYLFLRSKRLRNPYLEIEEKEILATLKIIGEELKHRHKFQLPYYLCLNAWFYRVRGEVRKSNKILENCDKICDKQENVLFKCFILQLKSVWSVGYQPLFEVHPPVHFTLAQSFTTKDWARIMHAFPLE